MPITRINEFRAAPEQSDTLRDFLLSVIERILGADGCQSCQLLRHHDDDARFAIVEVWDSIDSHQAAASRIPPELLAQARPLFAEPARGAYYDAVTT